MDIRIGLSILGIAIAIALVIVLSYKGRSPFFIGPLAALIICILSGLSFKEFVVTFGSGFGTFFGNLLFTFMFAMIFTNVMVQSGATLVIAEFMAKIIGVKHVATTVALIGAVLCMGGMSVSAYVTVYPIGLVLCSKSKQSEDILLGACMVGAWSFGICGPLIPSVHNTIAINALGTDQFAGLVPGLVGALVLAVAALLYLEWQARHWAKKGRTFTAWDKVPKDDPEANKDLPPVWRAFLPIVIVLVLYNVAGLDIVPSLAIGSVAATLFEIKKLKKTWFKTWEVGALNSLVPVTCVSAMSGIGACIAISPFFGWMLEILQNSTMHPYILTVLAADIVALCIGSASSALSTMMPYLAPIFQGYAAAGYDLGNIHRLAVFGCCGMDSLPQSGGVVGAISMFGTTHKKSYFPVFVTTVLMTQAVAFGVVLPLCLMGFH